MSSDNPMIGIILSNAKEVCQSDKEKYEATLESKK
jgi:hypothetical protein